MTTETKFYRGQVVDSLEAQHHWYMQEATATTIELDGRQMVRLYNLLLPADGWHPTEREAKAAVVVELVRIVGRLQAEIDTLKDDILHADLVTEAA